MEGQIGPVTYNHCLHHAVSKTRKRILRLYVDFHLTVNNMLCVTAVGHSIEVHLMTSDGGRTIRAEMLK